GDHASAVWIVRRDGLSVIRLAPKTEIESAVRRFVEAISAPEGNHAAPGRALAGLLLPEAVSTRRLIVVPHGILHYLPFETLPDRDGRFLLENHVISYAPSASTLALLRARAAHKAGEVIAIGNPVISGAGAAEERLVSIAHIGLLKP